MNALALISVFAFATTAQAQSKLQIKAITSSPEGFLVNSTLISGQKDAVLIDGQFTLSDAHRAVATILESRKNLTTIYVTHFHPDHYFGLTVIKQAFPKAKLVALPVTVADIKKSWKDKVIAWTGMYAGIIPTKPLVPTALKGNTITLEGETLEIVGPVQGDAANNSYVWIPSQKAVIAGDIVYSGVHPWTAETNADSRKAWAETINKLIALKPEIVVAGHKRPELLDDASSLEFTKNYLIAFDAAVQNSKTPEEVVVKLKKTFPNLALEIIAKIGSEAALKPATK